MKNTIRQDETRKNDFSDISRTAREFYEKYGRRIEAYSAANSCHFSRCCDYSSRDRASGRLSGLE